MADCACWLHDYIRERSAARQKENVGPPRAVVDERTTTIVEYIGFRPSWRLNVELILCWDVCFQVLGKMTDKCYGADERPARLRPSAA